jgi:uncharacterized protein (UPF0335 family)
MVGPSIPTPAADPYQSALALMLEHQKASASWLQRQLRIGYSEAARHVERAEREGYVSAPDHVGRRTVLRPPSATMPASSAEPPLWERNAGKYDVPSSGLPAAATPPRAPRRLPIPPIDDDTGASDGADDDGPSDIEALAEELVERFGLRDAAGLVAAIEEARALKELASAPDGAEPAVAHLFQIVERAEVLFAERQAIADKIGDLFKFAKSLGFNVAAIRACIKARTLHPELRKMQEAELEVYRQALGIEGPSISIALPRAEVAPEPRKMAVSGARARAIALAALAHQARLA